VNHLVRATLRSGAVAFIGVIGSPAA
jgi:hypothetical protein